MASDRDIEVVGHGGPAGEATLRPGTQAIIEAAADFMWSEEMQESIDAFSTNHASMFEGAEGVEGEHRLEWTQAHRDFQALFEFQLEAFVETQPFTQEDFLAACQDALDAGAGAGGDSYAHDAAGFSASIVNMVLMTSTYDFFVRVMIAAAAQEKLRRNLASMCASQPARSRPSEPLGCADPVACRKEREESTAGAE